MKNIIQAIRNFFNKHFRKWTADEILRREG